MRERGKRRETELVIEMITKHSKLRSRRGRRKEQTQGQGGETIEPKKTGARERRLVPSVRGGRP